MKTRGNNSATEVDIPPAHRYHVLCSLCSVPDLLIVYALRYFTVVHERFVVASPLNLLFAVYRRCKAPNERVIANITSRTRTYDQLLPTLNTSKGMSRLSNLLNFNGVQVQKNL